MTLLRVFKESEATHKAGSTVFSYNCRVFCSPSMGNDRFLGTRIDPVEAGPWNHG